MNTYKMDFEGYIIAEFKFDILRFLNVILECTIA